MTSSQFLYSETPFDVYLIWYLICVRQNKEALVKIGGKVKGKLLNDIF